jgi:hypothetical protein
MEIVSESKVESSASAQSNVNESSNESGNQNQTNEESNQTIEFAPPSEGSSVETVGPHPAQEKYPPIEFQHGHATYLSRQHLAAVPNLGKGDCAFRAIHQGMKIRPNAENIKELRHGAIEVIGEWLDNEDGWVDLVHEGHTIKAAAAEEGIHWKSYLGKVMQSECDPKQWVSSVVVAAVARYLKIKIEILTVYPNPMKETAGNESKGTENKEQKEAKLFGH